MTLPNPTPTPRQLLIEARQLIAKPQSWTQGAGARNAEGEPVPIHDPNAISWCASGALLYAMFDHQYPPTFPLSPDSPYERARLILRHAVRACRFDPHTDTATYNDSSDHGSVLLTFDTAIADAESYSPQALD